MDFPSTAVLVHHYRLFLVSGPLFLIVSATLWFRFARSFRKRSGPPPVRGVNKARIVIFAVASGLIGISHLRATYGTIFNAVRFRFKPEEISEIRIVKVAKEGIAGGSVQRTISDRSLLAEGFSRLSSAEGRQRNHESLLDGYRIQIIVAGSASSDDRFLWVFRHSTRLADATAVIPQIGSDSSGARDAGEYTCPSFHQWVATNIDPLFAGR